MYTSTGRVVKVSTEIFVADKIQKRMIKFAKGASLLKENDLVEVVYETAEVSPIWKNTLQSYATYVDETWEFHKVGTPHVSRL